DFEDSPVFITDSGDNTGSGAMGANTTILHDVLQSDRRGKRFLFANINDNTTFQYLNTLEIGTETDIMLGIDRNELTKPASLHVKVKNKGPLMGTFLHDRTKIYGYSVLAEVCGMGIDINIASNNWGMVEQNQFEKAGINWDEYDIIVVKIGYIFPELEQKGKLSIMSLTNGATLQDTRRIPFKRVMRPMYPLDEI
ncbi:MAG: MlrC C-terminal domain-containing protein, partial [Erysipelotrichaceae bacterium]|nr:MlrC C-terminal domain-containing protein [Erysipelotrichaceae bacterium]